MQWTKRQIDFLVGSYPQNSAQYCASALSISKDSVQHKVVRLGLKVSSERRSSKQSVNARMRWTEDRWNKTNVCSSQFESIESPHVAYLLGFLWADGNIANKDNGKYYIRLSIVEDDFNQLRKSVDLTGKWTILKRRREGRRSTIDASFNNKVVHRKMKDWGYGEKSRVSPCKVLSDLSDSLRSHWWRGFFDGDGCFYVNRNRYLYQAIVAGSEFQDWSSYIELLGSLGIQGKKVVRRSSHGNSSNVIMSKRSSVVKLGDYLYRNWNGIGLARKHEKYLMACR